MTHLCCHLVTSFVSTCVLLMCSAIDQDTCSAILALLDKDDDLRARHELLNTERILQIFQIGAEI